MPRPSFSEKSGEPEWPSSSLFVLCPGRYYAFPYTLPPCFSPGFSKRHMVKLLFYVTICLFQVQFPCLCFQRHMVGFFFDLTICLFRVLFPCLCSQRHMVGRFFDLTICLFRVLSPYCCFQRHMVRRFSDLTICLFKCSTFFTAFKDRRSAFLAA